MQPPHYRNLTASPKTPDVPKTVCLAKLCPPHGNGRATAPPRHASYCAWSLSTPDPGTRAQQDERDRQNNTLTQGQRIAAAAKAGAQPPMTTHHNVHPHTTTDKTPNEPVEDEDVQVPETPQASSHAPHAQGDERTEHKTVLPKPPTVLPPSTTTTPRTPPLLDHPSRRPRQTCNGQDDPN